MLDFNIEIRSFKSKNVEMSLKNTRRVNSIKLIQFSIIFFIKNSNLALNSMINLIWLFSLIQSNEISFEQIAKIPRKKRATIKNFRSRFMFLCLCETISLRNCTSVWFCHYHHLQFASQLLRIRWIHKLRLSAACRSANALHPQQTIKCKAKFKLVV